MRTMMYYSDSPEYKEYIKDLQTTQQILLQGLRGGTMILNGEEDRAVREAYQVVSRFKTTIEESGRVLMNVKEEEE